MLSAKFLWKKPDIVEFNNRVKYDTWCEGSFDGKLWLQALMASFDDKL